MGRKTMLLVCLCIFFLVSSSCALEVGWGKFGKRDSLKGITLNTGSMEYGIHLHQLEPVDKEEGKYRISGVGFNPSIGGSWTKGGWYSLDFLSLNLDKEPLFPAEFRLKFIERGQRKGFALSTEKDSGKVALEFTVRPLGRKLFLEIKTEPKKELECISITNTCFPGYLLRKEDNEKANRGFATATRMEKYKEIQAQPGKPRFTLDVRKEPWIFLFDDTMDPSIKPNFASSAVLYNPEEIQTAEVEIQYNARVKVYLNYPGDKRTIHLVYWDFLKQPNDTILKMLKEITVGGSQR